MKKTGSISKIGNIIKILIIIIFISLAAQIFFIPRMSREYTAEDLGINELSSPLDADGDGIDDWHDIMLGARAYIGTGPKYKSSYYEGGYPTDGYGVCTDVIWNGFEAAGYDLKSLVDSHIAQYPELYDMDSPDPNIDFRRVKNLRVFFENNAQSLETDLSDPEQWQPGDIVVFENHIAICSDIRNSSGIPFIIHHDPLGAREANDLIKYDILGHYRWIPEEENGAVS